MEPQTSSLKQSPLLDAQKVLKAQLGEISGWNMARNYGDSLQEHRAVRESAGLIDLSYRGVIQVGGKEATQFLNGLVTNDMKTLAPHKGLSAAFLTGHGKVRALCRVLRKTDTFLIINDPQTHDKVFKYVFPFSYAGDFPVEDVSESFATLSLQGPKAAAVLREICFEPVQLAEENDWLETIIGGHHVMVVRASHTGEAGFDILLPQSGLKDVWDFVLLKGAFHGVMPVGLDALDTLRIESGIPVYGIDVDENNMMLETGLADAVSFTKGCYTGQEAVAMATYRGHISKKLSGLLIEGEQIPIREAKISKDGKDIGQVTSAIFSPSLNRLIGLAYIKYGYFDAGNQVQIQEGDEVRSAQITELPFYKHLGAGTNASA